MNRRGFLLGVAATGAVFTVPLIQGRLVAVSTPLLRGDATFDLAGGVPRFLEHPPRDVFVIDPPQIAFRMNTYPIWPDEDPSIHGLREFRVDVRGQHFTGELVEHALRGEDFDACFAFSDARRKLYVASRVQVTALEAEALRDFVAEGVVA